MNRYNDQMSKGFTAVIEGAYSSRRRSEKILPKIANIEKPSRTYQLSAGRDHREQLFGVSFNFIDTTISVARPYGAIKKSEE